MRSKFGGNQKRLVKRKDKKKRKNIKISSVKEEKIKVVKPRSARSIQQEKSRTGPGTGPVEPENPGRAKNRDKTGHPSVESVTRSTRCRVNRFLLFFPSFDHTVPFLTKLHSFLTFYFIDFF